MKIFHSFFLTVALVLSSCEQPHRPYLPGDKPSTLPPELAERIERCGLDLGKATVIQREANDRPYHYISVGRHPVLSDPQMACLARLLVSAEVGLGSDDGEFAASVTEAWQKENSIYLQKLAKVWLATNKPSLRVPQFSGTPSDLKDFVAEVQRLCSAPKDTAEVTEPSGVFLPAPDDGADEAHCVSVVLTASNLHEHGIVVGGGVS